MKFKNITSLLWVLVALVLSIVSLSWFFELTTQKNTLLPDILHIFDIDSTEGKELRMIIPRAIIIGLSSVISLILFISLLKSFIKSSFVEETQ